MEEQSRIITKSQWEEYKKLKQMYDKSKDIYITNPMDCMQIRIENLEDWVKKLQEQIKEANEVIKFFAESKIGEKQEDGTYVVFTCGEKENGNVLGYKRYTYNPKPAVDYIKKWSNNNV